MKKSAILISAFFVLTAFSAAISNWKNDRAHSQLAFTVTHLGISDVSGTFNNFNVNVKGAKKDFSDAVFELNADVASIDTRIQQRNDHLKSADFFEVEKYPTLHFKSTSIKKAGKNMYELSGDLTIRDITRPVTMELLYRGTIDQPQAKVPTAGFQLTGTIKRSNFNIGPKFPAAMISDEVRIKADGEFQLVP